MEIREVREGQHTHVTAGSRYFGWEEEQDRGNDYVGDANLGVRC